MNDLHTVQVLDINTANQIAAGEVVEKPASVVKELVENALDAGATQVEVTIFEGGIEYIRVVDNGCGMSEENARLAVLRHATSKLRQADDLLHLHTLGFRGEALPSIASVSKFNLLTRPAEAEFATSVRIDGGENMDVSSMGGNAGTTVIVENLFFNVPARRKFLKTKATEGRYISELLTKLALSRPDVRFKLVHSDKEVLSTPGDGDLENTIRALYGKNVSQELLVVDFASPEVSITGFIGKPTLLKGTRAWQTLFVNGRSVGNKMLAKAIDHAYQSQIPKSGFPFAVLNIAVATASVDVNVHPQKSEIKFSDDSLIYKAMFKALTDALTRPMSAKKEITLLPDSALHAFVKPSAPTNVATVASNSVASEAKPSAYEPKFDVFKSSEPIFKTPEPEKVDILPYVEKAEASPLLQNQEAVQEQDAWQASGSTEVTHDVGYKEPVLKVYEAREQVTPAYTGSSLRGQDISFTNTDSGIATIWPIGQVDKTFIIAQSEDSLYLIDQHAAHERILYDKLVASHEYIPAQQLLMPLYMNLDAESIDLIAARTEEFSHLGVDAEPAGENMLRVSCLPADIKAEDAESFIAEICAMLREHRTGLTGSDLRQEVLHMTACKAAIKAGQLLNLKQMQQLIIDLCNTTHPFTCPHGRPCMIEINSDELYKMFKRTGF